MEQSRPSWKVTEPSARELCLQTLHLTPEQLWFLLLAGADPEVPTTAMTVATAMAHTFARRASGIEWLSHGSLLTDLLS